MNKRIKAVTAFVVCLVLFGLVILACVAVVFLGPQPTRVTRAQFELMNIGMTQAELENALGPPRNELRNPVIVWAPKGDGTIVSAEISPKNSKVRFFPNAGTRDQGREMVWVSESGLIAVTLDQNGRLRDKYFSAVLDPGRPSALDWLRSRPQEVRRLLDRR